jgi:2-dehydro-3-deoxyglucarate aldolase
MINKLYRRRLELKKKFRGRKRVFAAWTSIAHPSITEIFARSGVDFIGIDIEHSTISQEQSQRIIAACQAEETLCLPRIASHNMEMIKRLLDSGADGIIAPMISTPDEAKRLISWCKYPPLGKRSFGVARAQGYGFDFKEYTAGWNRSSSVIVQIESVEGVENIDDILSIRDIDGAMVGPYDLSGSLGIPGRLAHPLLAKACRRVVDACEKYGKSCGTQVIEPDSRSIKKAFAEGFTFIVLSSDVFSLWKWSERIRSVIRPVRTA